MITESMRKWRCPCTRTKAKNNYYLYFRNIEDCSSKKDSLEKTYNRYYIYLYLGELLKGVLRNTWGVIFANREKNQDKFETRHLEDFRARLFYRNQILTQVKYLGNTMKPFNMNVI